MNREVHVRFCEKPMGRFRRLTLLLGVNQEHDYLRFEFSGFFIILGVNIQLHKLRSQLFDFISIKKSVSG